MVILSQAPRGEGATTIPQGSTPKWVEAPDIANSDDDIVSSHVKA